MGHVRRHLIVDAQDDVVGAKIVYVGRALRFDSMNEIEGFVVLQVKTEPLKGGQTVQMDSTDVFALQRRRYDVDVGIRVG